MAEDDTSNVGRWNARYAGLTEVEPYGDTATYEIGARFLADCALVEDWGCGKGWLRRHVEPERYRGVDGSETPFADVVADLRTYRSEVDGVFLRHVLEHDPGWRDILANAVASARQRLVVILFTPLGEVEEELARCGEVGVPDLSLPRAEVLAAFGSRPWREVTLPTGSHYGHETVLLVSAEP